LENDPYLNSEPFCDLPLIKDPLFEVTELGDDA